MLIEYSVENFLSIKDKITFSLMASGGKEIYENVFEVNSLPKANNKALKLAAMYGANASGKTNILASLHFLRELVLHSHRHQKGDIIPRIPFRLDHSFLEKPSSLNITFVQKEVKYSYGVKLTEEAIIEEYLYSWPNRRKKILFERKNTNSIWINGDNMSEKGRMRSALIQEQTLNNTLLLSQATRLNHEEISCAFDWFKDKLRLVFSREPLNTVTSSIISKGNSGFKENVLKHLLAADFSIVEILCSILEKSEEFESDNVPHFLKEFLLQRVREDNAEAEIKEMKFGRTLRFKEEKFFHMGKGPLGSPIQVEFDIDEESEGTQKFYQLIGPIICVLQQGLTMIVDELDLHLHPFLATYLIKLFSSKETNPKNAQLVFSTHNIDLLDSELLRRDQIWFVARSREIGASSLYSLDEFSIRKDLDFKKAYTQGRFGGIPIIVE